MSEFWYAASDEAPDLHDQIFEYIKSLETEQSEFREANKCHAQFYSNREEPGLGAATAAFSRRRWAAVTENIIQSVIDTAKSLIGKSKPKIAILTEGANWDLQKLAKQLDKFLFGMFQHLGVYKLMPEVFRDACIFGTGCLKIVADGESGTLEAERVLVSNIYVDEGEVPAGGMPRQVHEVRPISREVLLEMYPDCESEIKESSDTLTDSPPNRQVDSDMVMVADSYYRSPGGDSPGRFVRSCSAGVLEDLPWAESFVPYVFFKWNEPVTGFYGQGLAEGLVGFQVRINELNDYIKKCHDLIAVPRVFVERSSQTLKAKLTNEIGQVVNYGGRPPVFHTPTAVNTETYSRVQYLKQSAFEFAGISSMAAHATRPEGIEAAVALRELSDNQAQRFSDQQARYEQAYVEVGQLIVDLVRNMRVKPKSYVSTRFVEEIDWPEADFNRHKFTLRAMPSSVLGETPAGKKQTIIEFAQYGVPLSPEEMRRLLDHPDLEQSDMLAKAKLEHTHWVINEIANERWVQPDSFMDLPLTLQLVNAAYLNAMMAGNRETGAGVAPPRVLEMYRQFLKFADDKLKELNQPTPEEMELMRQQQVADTPAGNVAETGLPGVLPQGADAAETQLAGLIGT